MPPWVVAAVAVLSAVLMVRKGMMTMMMMWWWCVLNRRRTRVGRGVPEKGPLQWQYSWLMLCGRSWGRLFLGFFLRLPVECGRLAGRKKGQLQIKANVGPVVAVGVDFSSQLFQKNRISRSTSRFWYCEAWEDGSIPNLTVEICARSLG